MLNGRKSKINKMKDTERILKAAMDGDINAFQSLFAAFQNQLKSYLYRLTADRGEAEDLTHDVFVRAFDKISTFKGDSSLKTWVFQIATNLAFDCLKKRKRWLPDAQDKAKELAGANDAIRAGFNFVNRTSSHGAYEIREHIDFCFTCISKTLPIERQIALILKDIYDFSVADVARIINQTEGGVKHFLHDARRTMTDIFDARCALVNKKGMCHQCTELNGIFNPKQNTQAELLKLELVRTTAKSSQTKLYRLRAKLVREIDPLHSSGADLQDEIMKCTRQAVGEI